jgi:hypothetical protein
VTIPWLYQVTSFQCFLWFSVVLNLLSWWFPVGVIFVVDCLVFSGLGLVFSGLGLVVGVFLVDSSLFGVCLVTRSSVVSFGVWWFLSAFYLVFASVSLGFGWWFQWLIVSG